MGVDFRDERRAIEKRFNDQWAGATPIRWDNVPFKIPDPPVPWVGFAVRPANNNRQTIGPNRLLRSVGIINIQLFAPEATGTNAIDTLVDTAAAIFDEAEFSLGNSGLIRCRVPEIDYIGNRDNDGWFQKNVICPYIRDKQD